MMAYGYRKRKGGGRGVPNRSDVAPSFEGVRLLTAHSKPLTLLGVSPRAILSEAEFKGLRSAVWRRAQSHCEACGRYVRCDAIEWGLRLFDNYVVDYQAQTYRFGGYHALCELCYAFVNPFVMGDDERMRQRVFERGYNLLACFGFDRFEDFDVTMVYVLEFRGFKYINDFYPSVAVRALERGVRVIHREKSEMVLDVNDYYHKPLE